MTEILVVDDEEAIRKLLRKYLEIKGHTCELAVNAAHARELLAVKAYQLILLDINMPGETGLDLLRSVLAEHTDTAVVMVTAVEDPVVAEACLELGAYDYITKPMELNRVLISVANALRRRELESANRAYRERLEQMVSERTSALNHSMQQLKKALRGTIHASALIVENRDPFTAGHQKQVAKLAGAMANELSYSADRMEGIYMGGLIHDLGKMSIPAEILSKPGRLTENEFNFIKEHPAVGANIIKDIEFPWQIAAMVNQHHERLDGSGYPLGLGGDQIIMEARILAVADVVEAMMSHRPYRAGLGIDMALEEIEQNSGILYDPDAVVACLKVLTKLEKL
jgi:putative nucleotidyltransferase with HDIG domain